MIAYIFFFSSLGCIFATLFYFTNLVMFKVKGETMAVRPKKNSPDYWKLKKQLRLKSLTISLVISAIALLVMLSSLISILKNRTEDTVSTLLIGSIGVVLLFVFLTYFGLSIVSTNKPKSTPKGRNDWLT